MNEKAFTFDANSYGQCGRNDMDKCAIDGTVPYCINDGYKYLNETKFAIGSCGRDHTVLLDKENQKIYSFGRNIQNQCGVRATVDQHSPCEITRKDIGIDDDCGDIVSIICGYYTTIFVCECFDV